MRIDFAYLQAMQARARRERSEAMYEMLLAPLIALVKRTRGLITEHQPSGRRMTECSSRTS